MPYTSQTKTWGPPRQRRWRTSSTSSRRTSATVTISAERAKVGCDAQLNITSDGPIDVNMVDCPTGTIEVVKDLEPDDDLGKFDLQVDGTTKLPDAGDGDTTGPVEVQTGANHSVGELGGTSTSTSNYASSIACTRNGNAAESGAGTSLAGIVVGANDTVVCTITNSRRYPRPVSASRLNVSLVPAYQACASPNRTHGPPLDHPSCAPPQQSSTELTIGATIQSKGSMRFATIVGDPETDADEADVKVAFSLTDVRRQSDSSDYTGEVTVAFTARITDRDGPATVSDFTFDVGAQCTSTSTADGGSCSATTAFDAIVPGVVDEGARAIWELGTIEVLDGGGEVFARQGIFVP